MKESQSNYALIMAGGVGSRFWPTSTASFPKQFQDLTGCGRTLLQQTVDRLEGILPLENIYILTNADYLSLVNAQLPELHQKQIICEPALRNTAPCILYAALKIQQLNTVANMIVLPSDHFIDQLEAFQANVLLAFERAKQQDELITFGIPPTSPQTGYGYLEVEDKKAPLSPIVKFTEKPDLEKANAFIKEGNYFWNSGLFVWSCRTIIKAFERYQPEMLRLFQAGIPHFDTPAETDFLLSEYPKAENISIDYAILEPSSNILMLKASFLWNDLGTWTSLYDQLSDGMESNVSVKAKLIAEEAKGNMVYSSSDKIIVIKGLADYVVVDEDKVLMIYPKGDDQSVKELRQKTKDQFGEDLA